jgi:hypothetical protein
MFFNNTAKTSTDAQGAAGADLSSPNSLRAAEKKASTYATVALGLGLSLFGAGCSVPRKPDALPEQAVAGLNETGELYKHASSSGAVAAKLSLAAVAGRCSIEDANRAYSQASGTSGVSSHLVVLAKSTNQGISVINKMYAKSEGWSYPAANLVSAAVMSGGTIEEANAKYKEATPWDDHAAAILVTAASVSGRSIQEINSLYNQSPVTGLPGSILVLGSVLSDTPMAKMNEMYNNADTMSSTYGAQLATLAALHGRSIERINALWDKSSGSGESCLNLVQAALISGRPIEEINYLFAQTPTWSSEAGSTLVLTRMAEEHSGGSLDMVPLIYTRPNGKSRSTEFMYLFVRGFEGRALPFQGATSEISLPAQ